MDYWLEVALVFVLCFLLGGLARVKHVLTTGGSVLAIAVGLIIGLTGGLSWVILLLLFLVTSFAAT